MADARKVPIDIAYRKLLEALVDRKIVPAKWADQHQQIRDGLALLYPALPASSDALAKFKLKHATHDALTYFDCRALLALLEASPEGQQKNFFGQFTSPTIKKWTALVRLYEKDNVFAAEAARVAAQNTAFEVPFLKKTMQQNDKHVADNKRKILDLTKSIAEYKRRLEASCAEIGIAGHSFREELQRLPRELPALFQQVAAQICAPEIEAALAYHKALQTYLHACDVPVAAAPAVAAAATTTASGKKDKKAKASTVTATDVLVVADRGEYTPFAFFAALQELRDASDVAVEEPPGVSLDFEAADVAEIDWDISVEGGGDAEAATIDWGIESLPSGARTDSDGSVVHVESEDAPVEIDWDISTEETVVGGEGSGCAGETTAATAATAADGFVIGGDAMTATPENVESPSTRAGLLSQNEFRGRVLNDLLELKVFLRQRREELADKTATNVAFASQFHGTSPLLEHQSDDQLKGYLAAVEEAIAQLTNKRLQQLVLIKNSERYLDRHVASLEMLTKHMDKCEREIKTLEDKNMDLVDATSRLQPQIDTLVAATKKLKRELEAALPPLFKGYKVNIVGDVNNL